MVALSILLYKFLVKQYGRDFELKNQKDLKSTCDLLQS